MKPVTEKQKPLIKRMERMLLKKFKGSTAQEASAFITENMEEYQQEREHAFNMIYNEDHY